MRRRFGNVESNVGHFACSRYEMYTGSDSNGNATHCTKSNTLGHRFINHKLGILVEYVATSRCSSGGSQRHLWKWIGMLGCKVAICGATMISFTASGYPVVVVSAKMIVIQRSFKNVTLLQLFYSLPQCGKSSTNEQSPMTYIQMGGNSTVNGYDHL